MLDKKQKSDYDLLGKTNRIVEQTTITGNIVCAADLPHRRVRQICNALTQN